MKMFLCDIFVQIFYQSLINEISFFQEILTQNINKERGDQGIQEIHGIQGIQGMKGKVSA